jgi:hypothetical protein
MPSWQESLLALETAYDAEEREPGPIVQPQIEQPKAEEPISKASITNFLGMMTSYYSDDDDSWDTLKAPADDKPKIDVMIDSKASKIEKPKTAPAAQDAKKRHVSRRDMRVLMMLRQVLLDHEEAETIRERAQTITKVEPAAFMPKPGTIEHYLCLAIGQAGDQGVHINDVITSMERGGFHFNSQYHKYAQVHSALRRNEFMFVKVKPATFRLRVAFKHAEPVVKTAVVVSHKHNDTKIPSLIDCALGIARKYKDRNLSPKQIWLTMRKMGYECSLEYITRVLGQSQKRKVKR